MKPTKLRQYYSLLTPAEKKKFKKWLAYETDGKHPVIELLYVELGKKQSKETIWKKLFPEEDYQDTKFRRISNQLIEYMESFLALIEFKKDALSQNKMLIQCLRKRKNVELMGKTLKKVSKQFEKRVIKDSTYYWFQKAIGNEWLHFLITTEKVKAYLDYFTLYEINLTEWIMYEKLHTLLIRANEKFVNNTTKHLDEEVLHIAAKDTEISKKPVIKALVSTYYFISNENYNGIEELIQTIKNAKIYLFQDLYHDLFSVIFNKVIEKINSTGEHKYRVDLLGLYEWGVKDRLIFNGGFLSIHHYKSLIVLSLRLLYFDRAEEYLRNYKKYLPEKFQEKSYRFGKAQIHFCKKEFRSVVNIFEKKPFINLRDELNGRIICLEAQYELGERVQIEDSLRAYLQFLNNKKQLGESVKSRFLNRAKILSLLIKVETKEQFIDLKKRIQETRPLNNQAWLLEKVNEALEAT